MDKKMSEKYLIIGGVAGGATAAARIRRNTENAKIILFEKGDYISYANCGLPYHIGDVIKERDRLFVQTPSEFGKRFNIDVRIKSEVVKIDKSNKSVMVRRSDGVEYVESYDKLLLSPGAVPIQPQIEGLDNEGVFTLRNVDDTDKIIEYIKKKEVKRAVVVGAGFIGLEMAENLLHRGIDVSVVEMSNQVMSPIDFSMAAIVGQHMLDKGLALYMKQGVEKIGKKESQLLVTLTSGKEIETEMILLSIGVRPQSKLAVEAGLEIGASGGIVVDKYLQTSDDSIYAVGDAIEYPHLLTGKAWLNYLAGPSNRQARIVADNMVYGNKVIYEGSIGTSIAKIFDLTVASVGLPAKKLKQLNIEYQSVTIHPLSHAGYYPGATPIDIKITFSPIDGKLYGAQIVGYSGVDKRIDEYAYAIKRGDSVYDLTQIEHAYAPPYSSAKDPVAISGYVAQNILTGKMKPIYWREFANADPSKVTLLDVRTADEVALNSIPGAINLPLDNLRERILELPSDKPVFVFCGVGLRGYLASNILKDNGFSDVRNLIGGLKTYNAAMLVQKSEIPNKYKEGKQYIGMDSKKKIKVDACGIQCPGPVLKLKSTIETLSEGELLEVSSTDNGFPRDAEAWCNTTGHRLIEKRSEGGIHYVTIEKKGNCTIKQSTIVEKGKTFILFSDDLDKALATFVLANGAAATGKKVTIFFTFWGLNTIKKIRKPKVKKDIFAKMFGLMLPADSLRLKLSKMNMFGVGPKMMRYIMKIKGVDSLESLRQQAIDNGVEFIACQMSMDVMGIKKEELLDNVSVGGVATYMERAELSNVNLFI